ncbi:MAG: carboxymuconolactone decarboxylase family protein [Pseudomonadota bacterium]
MFTYHDESTAPSAALPLIAASRRAYGFLPTLHSVLAESPATYRAYLETFRIFAEETALSPLEQHVVMMVANVTNRCHYCTAGHSFLMKLANLPPEVIEALRENQPLPDAKLEELRSFAQDVLDAKGHVGDTRLARFLDAGYTRQQALDVLTGLATKLLSNFTNALAHTKLDPAVEPYRWTHPDDRG